MKKHATTILLFVIMFVGLGLLLYPPLADYINTRNQSRAIARYTDRVESGDETDYAAYWDAARAYNERLVGVDVVKRLNNPSLVFSFPIFISGLVFSTTPESLSEELEPSNCPKEF